MDSDSANQLVTKITSYAGFATTGSRNDRRFSYEHDVYFDYFLATSLKKQILNGAPANFFDRGVLPDEVIEEAIDVNTAPLCIDYFNKTQMTTSFMVIAVETVAQSWRVHFDIWETFKVQMFVLRILPM